MKTKKKIIISAIIIAIVIAGFVFNYVFNSQHRDIANEPTDVTISAQKLFANFSKNEALATTNYLDKVIEIEGKITGVEENEIILNNKIQVGFKEEQMLKVSNATNVTIKGRCIGYDELLEMVKIDQATLINK